jgi:hypothetical protein
MNGEFYHPLGTTKWEADVYGLKLQIVYQRISLRWAEVTRAAVFDNSRLADTPAFNDDSNYIARVYNDNILPGTGWLFKTSKKVMRNYPYLVLARGPRWGRAVIVQLPTSDPRTEELVQVVRQAVGERWMGVLHTSQEKKSMGMRYAWWGWLGLGVLMCLMTACMILAVYPWALIRDWNFEEIAHLPLWLWTALLVWIVLVGGLYLLFRNRI